MRETNCKRMTRMMSLYVAGDLVGEAEREAAAHVAACQACRQLAGEFSVSSSLLGQAFAQPTFDAEFYAGIRRAVLDEITDDATASKRPLFERLWGRRWVFAASLAVFVIAIVTLQLFRGTTRETPRNVAFTTKSTIPLTPEQGKQRDSLPQSSGSGRATTTDKSQSLIVRTSWRRHSNQIGTAGKPDARNRASTLRDNFPEIATGMRPSVASTAPESVTPTDRSASPAAVSVSAAEISRIEIQTADPNIRIIWLAPRDSRKSEDINHDQDPEKGDRNQEASCPY